MNIMEFLSDVFLLSSQIVPIDIPAWILYRWSTGDMSYTELERTSENPEWMQQSGRP